MLTEELIEVVRYIQNFNSEMQNMRVGESDEPMSEYEIYSYDAFHKHIRNDIRKVPDIRLSLLDTKRFKKYIAEVKKEQKNLSENFSVGEILELMCVTIDNVPTLTGIITFSLYPHGYCPQLCITAIRVPRLAVGGSSLIS